MSNGDRASVVQDEKVLELDGDRPPCERTTTCVYCIKSTELFTQKWFKE